MSLGVPLSMATPRGGFQNSHQIKAHCLCLCLHQRQVQQQNQLGTIHCCWSRWKRDFQSYWVHLCGETHYSESEVNAHANQHNLETGQDRKSRQKSISQLVVWTVSLIVSWIDCIEQVNLFCCCALYKGEHYFVWQTLFAPELGGKTFHFHLHLKRSSALLIMTDKLRKRSAESAKGN